jgi:hypothetical protein
VLRHRKKIIKENIDWSKVRHRLSAKILFEMLR